MLESDRDQIEIFVDAIFRHAQTGFVSLRAFFEGSNDVFRKTPIRIISNNLRFLCDAVEDDARRAAQNPKPVVFCPPLATFGSDKSATEKDIVEGFTITVECDENPEAARAKLEVILGPATTVIRSGGVWSDGNGITQDKLHLHWRLAKPAREREDLVKLKRVREICAHLVNADPTSIPICHPIRWPGSWHRKGQPRLTEIVACDPDIEIELADALAKLEPLAPTPPSTNNRAAQAGGEWGTLAGNIVAGKSLHASIARLAMKMLRGGTPEVMAVQMLRGMMDTSQAPRDDRWQDRYDDIPRAVASAGRKLAAEQEAAEQEAAEKETAAAAAAASQRAPPQPQPQPRPQPQPASPSPPPPPPPSATTGPGSGRGPGAGPVSPVDALLKTFKRWLILSDPVPIYATLGAVAANLLEGDPVWLGIIAPPSSAKTELLNSLMGLPYVHGVSTLTQASLLSGTPRRQQTPGAKGGLLRQFNSNNFGIIVLKDFGSILSMRTESKAEILAALREIYDGAWTRHLGSDGGRTLEWKGKAGLIFGCPGVIDSHYSVISSLGDRFLLSRMKPDDKTQLGRAFDHRGGKTKRMRDELMTGVSALFSGTLQTPAELDVGEDDFRRLNETCRLAVRLRGPVDRVLRTREIESVHGAEGTARIGLALERLLCGMESLGIERGTAMDVILNVAMDSVPPLRRAAYCYLREQEAKGVTGTTARDVAITLKLPTTTVRRGLEELAVYGLARRDQGGKADLWAALPLP
jgi:hypothetical protein